MRPFQDPDWRARMLAAARTQARAALVASRVSQHQRPAQLVSDVNPQAAMSRAIDAVLAARAEKRRANRPGRRLTPDQFRRAMVGLPPDLPYRTARAIERVSPAVARAAEMQRQRAADVRLLAQLDHRIATDRDRRRKWIHRM